MRSKLLKYMPSNTLIQSGAYNSELPNWKGPKEKPITKSDLIEYYYKGYRDGKNTANKEIKEKAKKMLQDNAVKALTTTSTYFNELNKEDQILLKAYLKIEPLVNFKVIFLIDKSIFYSDKVNKIYKTLGIIENQMNSDNFYIDFSLVPNNGKVNEALITSYGFVFSYEDSKIS
jgi:hypothetical protein